MADGINQNIAILSLMAALKDNSKEITRDVEKLVTKVENNASEIHFKGNTEEVQDSIKEIVDLLNNKLKGVNTTKYLQPILEVFSDSTKSAQEYKKAVDDVKTSIGELASISSDKGAKAALPFLNQRDIDKAISIQKKVEEKQIASAKKISAAQKKANKVEHLSLPKLKKEYEKNEKYTSSISDNRVSEFASKMGIKSSTATVKNEVKEYSELLSLFELLHNKKKEMGEISTVEDALENIKITKTLLFLQGKIADKQQTLKSKYKANDISIGIPEGYSSINAYSEFGSIDQYVEIIKKQAQESVLKAKKELNDYIIERAEKHKAAADKEFSSSVEKTKKKYANVGTPKKVKEDTEPVENLGQTAKEATENVENLNEELNNLGGKSDDGLDLWARSAKNLKEEFADVIEYAVDAEKAFEEFNKLYKKIETDEAFGEKNIILPKDKDYEKLLGYYTRFQQLDQNGLTGNFELSDEQIDLMDEYSVSLDNCLKELLKIDAQDFTDKLGDMTAAQLKEIEKLKVAQKEVSEQPTTPDKEKQIEETTEAIDNLTQAEKEAKEQVEKLKKEFSDSLIDEKKIKELTSLLGNLSDNAKIKVDVDIQEAITNTDTIHEKIDKLPEVKDITIRVRDTDYSNTPLLSDEEGKTITAFRGVKNAWSGLVNDKGISFFTDQLELAADYADSLAESGKIYSANLSFKNPLEIDGNGAIWNEIEFDGVKRTTDEIVGLAKQLGHDGVIFRNIRDGFGEANGELSNVMVTLNEAQIKNEQVVAAVKANTGKMIPIENQQKLQTELEQTEQQAKEIVTTLSEINQSSVLSSDGVAKKLEQDLQNIYQIIGKIQSQPLSEDEIFTSGYYSEGELQGLISLLEEYDSILGRINNYDDLAESKYFKSSYFNECMEGVEPDSEEWDSNISAIEEMQAHTLTAIGDSILDDAAPIIREKLEKMFELDPNALRQHFEVYGGIIRDVLGSDEYYNWEDKIFPPHQTEVLSGDTTPTVKGQNELQEELKETDEGIQRVLYHFGELSKLGEQSSKSRTLGKGVSNSNYAGFNSLTGLYLTEHKDETLQHTINNKSKYTGSNVNAIDISGYKLFVAETDDIAEKIKAFFSHIGELTSQLHRDEVTTDVKPSNLKVDSVYSELKSLFSDVSLTYEEFEQFIKNCREIVSKYNLNELLDPTNPKANELPKEIYDMDSFQTQIMKRLGFDGLDLSKTKTYSGTNGVGTVVFDIGKDRIIEVKEYTQAIEELNTVQKQAQVNQTPLSSDSSAIIEENKEVIKSNEEVIASEEKVKKYRVANRADIPKLKSNVEPIKDTFDTTPETTSMEEVVTATDKAIESKKDFATANEGVQTSVDGSKSKLELEAELMESIAKNARDAAKTKKDFVKANKDVKESADKSSASLNDEAKGMSKVKESAEKKESSNGKSNKHNDEKEQHKKIVNELNDTIKEYGDAKKRIVSNKAVEGDIELVEELSKKISDLQKQPILSSSDIDESHRKLSNLNKEVALIEKQTKQKNDPSTKNYKKAEEINDLIPNKKVKKLISLAKDKIGTTEYEELEKNIFDIINLQGDFTKEVGASKESFEKLKEASDKFKKGFFDDLEINKSNVYDSFNQTFARITGGKNFSKNDIGIINTVQDSLKALNDFKLSGDTIEDGNKILGIINEISTGLKQIKAIPKDELLPNASEISKDLGKINSILAGGYKMPHKLKQEFKDLQIAYQNAFNSDGSVKIVNKEFQDLHNILTKLNAEFEATGKNKSLFGSIGQRWTDMNTKFLAQYFSFQDIIRYGRQAFETIKEYDTALTEMNKVSEESIHILKEFQKESFELADTVGTTASQIQNSTADFMRLGESLEEAKQSAKDANILLQVSEFQDISEATDALVAMSAAYKDLEKSQINDVLNEIGNNYSISTDQLASALQRSAATLSVAGNDIYEASALITAGNAILQDAESVGTGLKMISLRILGTEEAKNELASLGEDVDDFVVQTKSKLDETIRNYTAVASNNYKGVSVLDDNGNYKSTYEILSDISEVYQEILEADKKAGTNRGQALLEVLAGKNRSNVAASILNNPELLKSVYESARNSKGSAQEELDKQLDNIQSHLAQLKNAWDEIWINENNREFITGIIDALKGLLNIVNDFGGLKAILMAIPPAFAAVKSFKGEGRAKCRPLNEYAFGEFNSDVYELYIV